MWIYKFTYLKKEDLGHWFTCPFCERYIDLGPRTNQNLSGQLILSKHKILLWGSFLWKWKCHSTVKRIKP